MPSAINKFYFCKHKIGEIHYIQVAKSRLKQTSFMLWLSLPSSGWCTIVYITKLFVVQKCPSHLL